MSDDYDHNPFIKRLLRNYQETAERSLDGPTLTTAVDARLSGSHGRPARGVALGGDPHVRLETRLEGEVISCFVVGGERRLCVPQILNTILGRFTLSEINSACDGLRIHISLADDRQLTVLRRDRVLPETAHGCGLVTQSDAQRLCASLLGSYHHTQRSEVKVMNFVLFCRQIVLIYHRLHSVFFLYRLQCIIYFHKSTTAVAEPWLG